MNRFGIQWRARLLVVMATQAVFTSISSHAAPEVIEWGNGISGQTTVPPGLSKVAAIAAGGTHSLALTTDGRVVAWGDNLYGQGTVPSDLSNVVAIAAGLSHSLALTAEGRIIQWGSTNSPVPDGLSNVVAIAAGGSTLYPPHCLALLRSPSVPQPQLALSRQIRGLGLGAQGAPGMSCLLLRVSDLNEPWRPYKSFICSNAWQSLEILDTSQSAQFFRLLRK
jgi:hypothetical protein